MTETEKTAPSADRYEQMLERSATAAICAGHDNLILSWNIGAEQLFGHTAAEAIGQPLSIIIPVRHRAAHEAGLARAVQAGRARLAGSAVEILALHADGHELPVELCLSMWFERGEPMFGALLRDIADRQAAKLRLEHLAHCDTLTSLPNRNALHAGMTTEVNRGPFGLVLLDLDGFKYVNDSLGHSVGDELLTLVAARLAGIVGSSGLLARLGGDEFAILLLECADPLKVDELSARILAGFKAPFELAGQSIFVGTSVGIAMFPKDASNVEQMLSNADLALYSSKEQGGGVRTFFSRAMQIRSEQRQRLGNDLRRALTACEFELLYQPQISLVDQRLCGVEALLRWRHPDHGLLAPHAFMEALEESAIVEEVGDWIIDEACAAAAEWNRLGLVSLRIGVNVFPAQLRSGRLSNVIAAALQRQALPAHQLEIEITENTVLRYNHQSAQDLWALRRMGVGIAFDDFGTGFASLSMLQKYPLSRLKIDRSFVSGIACKAGDKAIVEAVVAMARSLNLAVIAEGVESAEQEATLIGLGCDEGQGYRYGRPMTARAVVTTFSSPNAVPLGIAG